MSLSILINTKILCLAVLGLTMKYAQSLSSRSHIQVLIYIYLKKEKRRSHTNTIDVLLTHKYPNWLKTEILTHLEIQVQVQHNFLNMVLISIDFILHLRIYNLPRQLDLFSVSSLLVEYCWLKDGEEEINGQEIGKYGGLYGDLLQFCSEHFPLFLFKVSQKIINAVRIKIQ